MLSNGFVLQCLKILYILVVYIYWGLGMKAKVFKSGNSLAIRLPKAFNLTKDCELDIKQINNSIVLTPANSNWDSLFSAIDSFKGEIKRDELILQDREWQK